MPLVPISWEGRPALVDRETSEAWFIGRRGGAWEPVDAVEVLDSGHLIESIEAFFPWAPPFERGHSEVNSSGVSVSPRFFDWEGRAAVVVSGVGAWVAWDGESTWRPVDSSELVQSGRPLSPNDFAEMFPDAPSLPVTADHPGGNPPIESLEEFPNKRPPAMRESNSPVQSSPIPGRVPMAPSRVVVRRMQFAQAARRTKNASRTSVLEVAIGLTLAVLVFGYMSLGIEVLSSTPPNALVYIHHVKRTYASPPCVFDGTTDFNYITNLDDVRRNQAKPVLTKDVEVVTRWMVDDLNALPGK